MAAAPKDPGALYARLESASTGEMAVIGLLAI